MGRHQEVEIETHRPRAAEAGDRSWEGMRWKKAPWHQLGGTPVQAQLRGSTAPGQDEGGSYSRGKRSPSQDALDAGC